MTARLLGAAIAAVAALACGKAAAPPAQANAPGSAPPAQANASGAVPPKEAPAASRALKRASVKLFGTLRATMEFEIYASTEPPEVREAARELGALVSAYQTAAASKLTVRVTEVRSDEDARRAKADGLAEFGGERPAYLGLVLRYRGDQAVIPQFSLELGLATAEFWITNKMRELRDRADGTQRRIGVVAQKSELALDDRNLVPRGNGRDSPSIASILEQAFPFYRIERVDLGRGKYSVDPALVGLVVTQPGADYLDEELRRIDEFLMRGEKSLAVFASAVNVPPRDARLRAKLDTHNLNRLLGRYGITMNEDAVLDHGDCFRVEIRENDTTTWVRHPGIPRVANEPGNARLDPSSIQFFRMDELMFPFASSLTLDPKAQPTGVTLRALARSTEKSSIARTPSVDMTLGAERKPASALEPRVVAAIAEGKLESAFPSATAPASAPARVVVVASSLFLTNPFAYAGNDAGKDGELLQLVAQRYTKNLTNTILVLKNTLDWMTNEQDFVELAAMLVPERR